MAYEELTGMLSEMEKSIEQGLGFSEALTKLSGEDFSKDFSKLRRDISGQINSSKERFSMAIVGEFNTGKSTFLNGLLGLSGASALSTDDTPETACPTIIKQKEPDSESEAYAVYENGRRVGLSWPEARELTSQVAQEKDPALRLKADGLLEIEYYVANELLAGVNLIDLPGTGSRYVEEHTEFTHQKMREADLILWLVSSEEEPSFSASIDLRILSEIASAVIPVINVQEDPSADPPLPKDPDSVRDISNAITTEFRQFFAEDITAPFEVSSRVIELEMQKKEPSQAILEQAGLTGFLEFLSERFLNRQETLKSGKFKRLCGNIKEIADRTADIFTRIKDSTNSGRNDLQKEDQDLHALTERIEDLRFEHRTQIRPVAKSLANRIIQHISGIAKLFIEDTLTMANVPDLTASIGRKGRDGLKKELTEKFENEYIELSKSPNWLDGMREEFANDVYDLLYPDWKRIYRISVADPEFKGDDQEFEFDIGDLPRKLREAVFDVIERVLSIGAVAALLVWIPGGQILDAVAIIGLIILSVFKDPLEKPRVNAVKRTRFQLDAQKPILSNELLKAGMMGNKVFEDEVMGHLENVRSDMKERAGSILEISTLADNTTEVCSSISSRLARMQ